ncbi:MAG: hypothetical protein BWY63_03588 [Chloroflexi bacterium ADurb.Bin360]|nr:MAG: hypothetical protein BWY63_03588 [Chloroflexi bacterium ADurb.Bin360]
MIERQSPARIRGVADHDIWCAVYVEISGGEREGLTRSRLQTGIRFAI